MRKRLIQMRKETNTCEKRDQYIWKKRPIHMRQETNTYEKRDVYVWEKKPIRTRKETNTYGKKDLDIWKKRPIQMRPINMKRNLQQSKCAHRCTHSSQLWETIFFHIFKGHNLFLYMWARTAHNCEKQSFFIHVTETISFYTGSTHVPKEKRSPFLCVIETIAFHMWAHTAIVRTRTRTHVHAHAHVCV